MIKNYFLVPLFLLGVVLTINAQIVNIPDINFKTALINNSSVNTNGDDEIQVSEAESFNQPLAIYDRNISDLTGLESFINITYLDCSDNPINNINISNNSKLVALYCNSTNITDIDLTQNIELEYIQISGNAITTIDITKNTKLLSFTCQDSQINSIDFSNNIELNFLNLSGNSLNNIDLSKNTKLDVINLNSNLISQINVSNNTLLEDLFIDSNQLTQIDISNNLNLKNLHIDKNKLTSLNTSHNVNLTGLNAEFNEINSIDLNNNINLITLKLSYNNLPTLDLTKNTQLKTLRCGKNNLTSLDLSQNVELIALYLFSSGINDLDLQFNTKLKILDTQHSKINSINLLKNTLLERITMSRFNGSSIDFSKNTSLQRVYFNSSPNINDLDFSNNPNLTQLYLSGNDNITRINIANNNNNIISNFNAKNNSNLTCIQIDSGFTPPSTWYKDTTSSYSDNCTQYKLSLANSTNGNIDVTPNRSTLVYEQNMDVILTATPDAGYQFDGWSGDTTGNTNPLTITMDTDKTVTALFSKIQHTLTTNATNGSISRNPDTPTSGTYDIGTDVILTASPDAGYQFDGWSGDATGNTNPLTITMDADKTITAIFSEIPSTIEVSTFASGFTSLEGIAINSNNEVFVSEHDSGKIYSIDTNGNSTEFASSGFRLNDIVFNKEDKLFAAQVSNDDILISDNSGNLSEYIDAFGKSPYGLTFYDDKLYYTSDFGNVYNIDINKNETTYINGFLSAAGIDFDSKGNAYIADKNDRKLYKVDNNGTKTEIVNGTAKIIGVKVVNDIVYFTSSKLNSDKIVKYNPETNTTEDYVTTSLDDPRNLDVDYIGNMYITNGGNGTVVKVHDENLKQATASINDEAFNNQLTIFPNPVKNNLTIKSNNHSIIKNVVILDLLGKEIIKTQELNINISNLPNGVYLLKIKGENNKIAIKKFIKQ